MKASISCTKKSLFILPPGQLLVQYIRIYNNEITIYDTHINFNGHISNNYGGSRTFSAHVTADKEHILTFGEKPYCLQLLNLRGQGFWVILKQEKLFNCKVIGVSVSADPAKTQQQKSSRKARKIYILIEEHSCLSLKIIQFQSQLESQPKQMHDTLRETQNNKDIFLKPGIIFSFRHPAVMICCPRGQIRVCSVIFRKDHLEYPYFPQHPDPAINQILKSGGLMAFAEGPKTWVLVYRNKIDQISVNQYLQHNSNQLTKDMYSRANSFVKTTDIRCSAAQFLSINYVPFFYIIETGSRNSHKCWIIQDQEMDGDQIAVVDLLPVSQSQICFYSLTSDSSCIKISQIKNHSELIQNIVSEQILNPSQEKTATTMSNQSNQGEKKYQPQATEQIAKFKTVREENQSQEQPPVKSLINPVIMDAIVQREKEEQEGSLQVPGQLNHIVSFGKIEKDVQKKEEKKQQKVVSQKLKKQTDLNAQNKLISSEKSLNDKKIEKESKPFTFPRSSVLQIFNPINKKYLQDLIESQKSLKQSYSINKIKGQTLFYEPIFNSYKLELFLNTLISVEKCHHSLQSSEKLTKQISNQVRKRFSFVDYYIDSGEQIIPNVGPGNFRPELSKLLLRKKKPEAISETQFWSKLGSLKMRMLNLGIKAQEHEKLKPQLSISREQEEQDQIFYRTHLKAKQKKKKPRHTWIPSLWKVSTHQIEARIKILPLLNQSFI